MLQSNTRCPDPAELRACGCFSQDVQFNSFGTKKTRIGRLEKNGSPMHLLIKEQGEDTRDPDYSDKWKLPYDVSIKHTLPRPAGKRACRGFSQDVQFDSFGSQKTKILRLEKNGSPMHLLIKEQGEDTRDPDCSDNESYHTDEITCLGWSISCKTGVTSATKLLSSLHAVPLSLASTQQFWQIHFRGFLQAQKRLLVEFIGSI